MTTAFPIKKHFIDRDSRTQLRMGTAPAPGAVCRASRLTQALEFDLMPGQSACLSVRREARRTAAEAAALPSLFVRVHSKL